MAAGHVRILSDIDLSLWVPQLHTKQERLSEAVNFMASNLPEGLPGSKARGSTVSSSLGRRSQINVLGGMRVGISEMRDWGEDRNHAKTENRCPDP